MSELTSRQKWQKKYHREWLKKNRQRAREIDTKHRNSPKGLATRKIWDDKNRESRNKYYRDYRKSLKLQK
jgi:hypothetical protein